MVDPDVARRRSAARSGGSIVTMDGLAGFAGATSESGPTSRHAGSPTGVPDAGPPRARGGHRAPPVPGGPASDPSSSAGTTTHSRPGPAPRSGSGHPAG